MIKGERRQQGLSVIILIIIMIALKWSWRQSENMWDYGLTKDLLGQIVYSSKSHIR